MKSTIFKTARDSKDIFDFLKHNNLIEQEEFENINGNLIEIKHEYFEITSDGDLVLIAIYNNNDDIKLVEKEFNDNIFVNYIFLIKDDFSEYIFLKYDEGTGKSLKMRKKKEDLNTAFLKKLNSLRYDNIESFEKIFDRSELIKDFYTLYCAAEDYLMKNIKGIPYEDEKELFVKLMIQRVMFLWFLQKKGFLDNNKNYLIDKFNRIKSNNENFYLKFLKNLFFNGLCKKENERDDLVKKLIGEIPYLNGGLFTKSEVELKYDGSIKIENNTAFYKLMEYPINTNEKNIPLLNLLDCKEWTIDERSGDVDKLNPEVLGYIFEKSINQKDLGAVYTPEEITTYICRNTIYPYVISELNEKFNLKMEYNGFIEEDLLNTLNKEQLEYLLEIIKDIKIIDPAVGSGHFLVDAIVILEKLYNYLRDKDIIGYSNFQIREHIVTENLFGVDILPGAIEICKLRLFLALAETFRTISDIKPLPNIEFNIRCGNSLLGFVSKNELTQNFIINSPSISALSDNMAFLRNHSNETSEILEKILSKFDVNPIELFNLRNKLVKQYRNLHDHDLQTEFRAIIYKITDAFNFELNHRFYGEVKAFIPNKGLKEKERFKMFLNFRPFHWVMEYSEIIENNGFDIIIGNPPYISAVTHSKENSEEREVYRKIYEEVSGAFDVYILFLLRMENLISPNGFYSLIIPNKFLVADYAKPTLEKMKYDGLHSTIDVSKYGVFADIGTYPIIIVGDGISSTYANFEVDKISDLKNNKLKVIKDMFKFKSFKDFNIRIGSGTTGFQATAIKPLIFNKDNKAKNSIPFAVSGSIDPYIINTEKIRYMKTNYEYPYIKYDPNIIADSKWQFWTNEKIVVAGMTKRIESCYIEKPLALGVGCYAIFDFGNFNPKFLLALLNSKFLSVYLNIKFKDKHLAGGYLAINKSTIEQLPLVNATTEEQDNFVILVDQILNIVSMDDYGADPKKRAKIKEFSEKIDKLVYQLYELNSEEIKFVEEFWKNNYGE